MRKHEKFGTWIRSCLILSILCIFAVCAQAQTVSGIVKDSSGEAIIGATVKVSGSNGGAVTDAKGHYSVSASRGSILTVSYIGYLTKQVRLSGENVVDVVLQEDNTTLNDVVVVGYGVQKKKLVTGATVQVKGDDLAKLSTTSALTAMQSQTPGVSIMQNSGQAGEGYKVNIRGIGTTGNSDPLYVIDGVAGGSLNDLNPSDIESIDVLKDAASAAIYGARAANGVILVTTRQGKSGKIQVAYDGYIGKQYLAKAPDALNAQEYVYSRKLREFNGGAAVPEWEQKLPASIYQKLQNGWEGTDWINESYHKGAVTQNHSISLAGGSEVSKFS